MSIFLQLHLRSTSRVLGHHTAADVWPWPCVTDGSQLEVTKKEEAQILFHRGKSMLNAKTKCLDWLGIPTAKDKFVSRGPLSCVGRVPKA
jgi:hypothetical protein